MAKGPPAGRLDPEVFLAPPAALGGRFTQAGRGKALVLEPFERLVDRRDGDVTARPLQDFAVNGDAVRAVPQPDQREKDELLEISEAGRRRHGFLRRCLSNKVL